MIQSGVSLEPANSLGKTTSVKVFESELELVDAESHQRTVADL